MTITVAPDPAQVQASALKEMNRLSRAASAKVMRYQYFVFFREPYRADRMAENEGCMETEEIAINHARSIRDTGSVLICMTRVDTEKGESIQMMNAAQLDDAVDDLVAREEAEAANDKLYGTYEQNVRNYYNSTR